MQPDSIEGKDAVFLAAAIEAKSAVRSYIVDGYSDAFRSLAPLSGDFSCVGMPKQISVYFQAQIISLKGYALVGDRFVGFCNTVISIQNNVRVARSAGVVDSFAYHKTFAVGDYTCIGFSSDRCKNRIFKTNMCHNSFLP